MWYISSVCFERTETPKEVYCISSCCIQKYFFNSSHITCGLDLQGKRMKRKRKLQAEGGEEDMAVGEMSYHGGLEQYECHQVVMTNGRPASCQHTQGVRWDMGAVLNAQYKGAKGCQTRVKLNCFPFNACTVSHVNLQVTQNQFRQVTSSWCCTHGDEGVTSLVPSPHAPPRLPARNGLVNQVELLGLIPKCGHEIVRLVIMMQHFFTTAKFSIFTRVSVPFLSRFGTKINVLNVARLHCLKSVLQPKKFKLVHHTISPCERVGSGDETK